MGLSAITCCPLVFLPIYRLDVTILPVTHLSCYDSAARRAVPTNRVVAHVSQQMDTDRIHYRDIRLYALTPASQNNESVLRKPNSSRATRTIETERARIGGREVEDEKGRE